MDTGCGSVDGNFSLFESARIDGEVVGDKPRGGLEHKNKRDLETHYCEDLTLWSRGE